MNIVRNEDPRPEVELTTLNEVPSLLLEHGVVVRNCNEFLTTEALGIRNVCEVWVPLLTELPDH